MLGIQEISAIRTMFIVQLRSESCRLLQASCVAVTIMAMMAIWNTWWTLGVLPWHSSRSLYLAAVPAISSSVHLATSAPLLVQVLSYSILHTHPHHDDMWHPNRGGFELATEILLFLSFLQCDQIALADSRGSTAGSGAVTEALALLETM
jgi:hypothetical protein